MKLKIRELVLFGMLGGVMYTTKFLMEFLPNIHLLGMLITAITVVFRWKALYPLYVYVLLDGLFAGFAAWWLPYLYVWTVLWGLVMLLPRNLPPKAAPFIYAGVAALHGFAFGTLYAPGQALLYGLDFRGMLLWIAAGFPFDCIHGISNFICGFLVIPLTRVLRLAQKN